MTPVHEKGPSQGKNKMPHMYFFQESSRTSVYSSPPPPLRAPMMGELYILFNIEPHNYTWRKHGMGLFSPYRVEEEGGGSYGCAPIANVSASARGYRCYGSIEES